MYLFRYVLSLNLIETHSTLLQTEQTTVRQQLKRAAVWSGTTLIAFGNTRTIKYDPILVAMTSNFFDYMYKPER